MRGTGQPDCATSSVQPLAVHVQRSLRCGTRILLPARPGLDLPFACRRIWAAGRGGVAARTARDGQRYSHPSGGRPGVLHVLRSPVTGRAGPPDVRRGSCGEIPRRASAGRICAAQLGREHARVSRQVPRRLPLRGEIRPHRRGRPPDVGRGHHRGWPVAASTPVHSIASRSSVLRWPTTMRIGT